MNPANRLVRRWRAIFLVSALALLTLAIMVSLSGVLPGERTIYQ